MAGANEATGAKGGSKDLEVASSEALQAEAAAASSSTGSSSNTISSLAQLSLVVGEHVGNGAAAERVMSDSPGFQALLDAAEKPEAESQDRLGGNAALMGKEMASLGVSVMLGGRIGPSATALIGGTMQVASRKDSDEGQDDTHLILEYGQGEAWRSEESPRANRFIVTQDQGLADIQPLRDVIDAVKVARRGTGGGFDADAVVVAGLHMLEQLPEAEWRAKLDTVSEWLQELPSDVAVHVELASVASTFFMEYLADKVVSVADSVGMNEQELADLYEAIGGRYADAETSYTHAYPWPACNEPSVKTRKSLTGGRDGPAGSHSMPRIDACVSASRHVMLALPSLTRLHLHTLGFHAIVQASPGAQANSTSRYLWRDAFGAVASGATTAAERACGASAQDLTDDDLEFRTSLTFDGGDAGLLAAMKLHGVDQAARDAYDAGDYEGAEGFAARMWMMARPMVTRLSRSNPIASFQRPRNPDVVARALLSKSSAPHTHLMDITVAPVPVCKTPKSTVGLGDAVSAAGLVGHAVQRSQAMGTKLELDPIPPAERVRVTGAEPTQSRDEL